MEKNKSLGLVAVALSLCVMASPKSVGAESEGFEEAAPYSAETYTEQDLGAADFGQPDLLADPNARGGGHGGSGGGHAGGGGHSGGGHGGGGSSGGHGGGGSNGGHGGGHGGSGGGHDGGHGGDHGGGHGGDHGGNHGGGHDGGHGGDHGGGHGGDHGGHGGDHDGPHHGGSYHGHGHYEGHDYHHGYGHSCPREWRWNRARYPRWYTPHARVPSWYWVDVPRGYWQCTAFNQDLEPYVGVGRDIDSAAYSALYECGDTDYDLDGCYIPQGYCQYRR